MPIITYHLSFIACIKCTMSKIVIDAGHGGTDPGAVNGTRLEKNDNLRMALAVRDILRGMGQTVIMTRDSDVFVPLAERSAISNRNNPDIFVSIHRNASVNSSASGVDNFIRIRPKANEQRYAQTVLDQVAAVAPVPNRGVKQENFSVLRNTNAPSQLLEMLFISNDNDNKILDENFNAYTEAIARGIMNALGQRPTAPTPPPTTPPSKPTTPPSNTAIRQIQSALNSLYGTGLTVDGILGPMTRRAMIIGLQTELNKNFNAHLTVDGIFGSQTSAAVPLVRQGSEGNLVWLLQAALVLNGFPLSNIDGIFGPQTATALRSFQQSRGLTVDGIAGGNTFAALFS
jgi:hypothetical protein